jgi:hypothetical protein
MKRIICVILAAAMLLLTSCGTVETNETPKTENENNIGITSTTPTDETEEEIIIEEEEEEVIEEEETEEGEEYILNTNSKKFHLPDCSGAKNMSEKNKEVYW